MKNILLTLIILIVNSCRFEKNNEVDVCATFDEIDAKIVALMDEIQVKHKDDRPFLDAFNMEQSIGFNIEIVDYVPYIPKNGISIIGKIMEKKSSTPASVKNYYGCRNVE